MFKRFWTWLMNLLDRISGPPLPPAPAPGTPEAEAEAQRLSNAIAVQRLARERGAASTGDPPST